MEAIIKYAPNVYFLIVCRSPENKELPVIVPHCCVRRKEKALQGISRGL